MELIALKGRFGSVNPPIEETYLPQEGYSIIDEGSYRFILCKDTVFKCIYTLGCGNFYQKNKFKQYIDSCCFTMKKGEYKNKTNCVQQVLDDMEMYDMLIIGHGNNKDECKLDILKKASFTPAFVDTPKEYIDYVEKNKYLKEKYKFAVHSELLEPISYKIYEKLKKRQHVMGDASLAAIHNNYAKTYITYETLKNDLHIPEEQLFEALKDIFNKHCIFLYDKVPKYKINKNNKIPIESLLPD